MSKTLQFVRLDFLTIKPYFTMKNILIFALTPLILMYYIGGASVANGIFMTYALTYVSYPFVLGEQCNIDALYAALSIPRRTVVLGRYLFALIFDVCAGFVSCIYSFVTAKLLGKGFSASESIIVVIALLLTFSFFQIIQIPIYFKLGYAKAKMLANMPFLVLAALLVISSSVFGSGAYRYVLSAIYWMERHQALTALVGVSLWFGLLYLSYRLSVVYYSKRDF